MQQLREEALRALAAHLPQQHIDAAMRCAQKLHEGLPHKEELRKNHVLVAYGGGKDSSYTIAFVRCMQLLLSRTQGQTFKLLVVTNRHAGMPRAVMENIARAYRALRLPEDPDCEALLIDGNEINPFRVDRRLPRALVQQNRDDILMTGHRTFADARPTFCNACNLSMVNSFGLAASYGSGVDVIITGDSRREQRAYYVWVARLAQKFGFDSGSAGGDFGGFLARMRSLSHLYFRDLHGGDATDAIERRLVTASLRKDLQFFSIYDDTQYASGEHWDLLTRHLGFEFDEIAFSFSESDCANPALMAHLRGLKCERMYGRSYAEGIAEYVDFAVGLMRKKEFPKVLVDMMLARYDSAEKLARMRSVMDDMAREVYGLDEQQLVCMTYSPFAARCQNLDGYLKREQPGLAPLAGSIRELLQDGRAPAAGSAQHEVKQVLERLSGLTLSQLRVIYASPLHPSAASGSEGHLIEHILARDPHKDVIQTRHAPGGSLVQETISGR
ncbi:PqqD family protein [Sorangium sp. So ce1389]|uniref:PqqD family protein n=1 Tax=Sorangium sp. So ce1389 TaxID=3133336 RepID=UPI003F63B47F